MDQRKLKARLVLESHSELHPVAPNAMNLLIRTGTLTYASHNWIPGVMQELVKVRASDALHALLKRGAADGIDAQHFFDQSIQFGLASQRSKIGLKCGLPVSKKLREIEQRFPIGEQFGDHTTSGKDICGLADGD